MTFSINALFYYICLASLYVIINATWRLPLAALMYNVIALAVTRQYII